MTLTGTCRIWCPDLPLLGYHSRVVSERAMKPVMTLRGCKTEENAGVAMMQAVTVPQLPVRWAAQLITMPDVTMMRKAVHAVVL